MILRDLSRLLFWKKERSTSIVYCSIHILYLGISATLALLDRVARDQIVVSPWIKYRECLKIYNKIYVYIVCKCKNTNTIVLLTWQTDIYNGKTFFIISIGWQDFSVISKKTLKWKSIYTLYRKALEKKSAYEFSA